MSPISAYEVSVIGTNWTSVINERTAGRAKASYWRDVHEAWPSIPFTAMRARRVSGPASSEEFARVATYRGLPHVRCGDRVTVGGKAGVIVGHNSSANFDVLFDDSGLTLNVHPASCEFAAKSEDQ